jgi:hypothetical protein
MTEMPDPIKGDAKVNLGVDERCLALGRFATLTLAVPFMHRLRRAMQSNGFGGTGRLVQYYDDTTFHGRFGHNDIPFKKQMRLSHQNEYRFCVDANTAGDNPLLIDIGDISDVCKVLDTCDTDSIAD